jgi:Predicted transcriptional regulators
MRAAREKAGLSQLQAAAELEVTKGALSAWENDKYLPQLETFRRLCQLYLASADALLFPVPAAGACVCDTAPPYESADLAKLQGWLRGLDDQQRRGLIQFLGLQ